MDYANGSNNYSGNLDEVNKMLLNNLLLDFWKRLTMFVLIYATYTKFIRSHPIICFPKKSYVFNLKLLEKGHNLTIIIQHSVIIGRYSLIHLFQKVLASCWDVIQDFRRSTPSVVLSTNGFVPLELPKMKWFGVSASSGSVGM